MSLPPHFSHILNLTVKLEVRGDLFRGVMVSKEKIEGGNYEYLHIKYRIYVDIS